MSQTKNQAIENQKLKLENEQLKTLVNCLQSQVCDLVIESTKEEPSIREILDSITPELVNEPTKIPMKIQTKVGVLEIGDTVLYCVDPGSLYVGVVQDLNDRNQVFLEQAVFLQFKGQLRLTAHGKDCCIADAIRVILPKHEIPIPKN